MGLPGKPGHEMGKMAALMWAAGDYEPVIQYCMSDAQQLGQIYDMGYRYRKIKWVTNKGDTSCFPLPLGWLSVAQCLKLAEPDTSWMEKPWDRKEGLEWLLK
jgi:hypothetical protein